MQRLLIPLIRSHLFVLTIKLLAAKWIGNGYCRLNIPSQLSISHIAPGYWKSEVPECHCMRWRKMSRLESQMTWGRDLKWLPDRRIWFKLANIVQWYFSVHGISTSISRYARGIGFVTVSTYTVPIPLVLCKDVKSIQYSQCRILAKLITCSDTIQEEYGHGVINFQADSSRLRKLPTALENRDGCAERNRPDPTREVKLPEVDFEWPHYQVYSPKGQSVPLKSRCSENHCNIIV